MTEAHHQIWLLSRYQPSDKTFFNYHLLIKSGDDLKLEINCMAALVCSVLVADKQEAEKVLNEVSEDFNKN
jgi:hypothetical protein